MKPLNVLLASAASGAAALAAAYALSVAIQRQAAAHSHELPPYVPPAAIASVPPAVLAKTGEKLYFENCAHCHGVDAHGDEGPDLHDIWVSNRRIATVVKRGIKGEMPTFATKLNDTDIAGLIAYIRTLH
ncbi:MAG TPA: cytochrome c [Opitutaceae bacterium]|nr:cytochrome c [Opitutaceae bacterium]